VILADALPGLGIVAAVLGVIITMGSLTGQPSLIGQKVATALVGTFIGILSSYGLVAPVAAGLEKMDYEELQYYETLRAGLMAYVRGMPAAICVEYARRSIPTELRPDFEVVDKARRQGEKFRQIDH
jgi:chemotaxis protein MotA